LNVCQNACGYDRQEPPVEFVTHVIITAAILGLGLLAADPALAQQVPAAIVADAPADKEFPAALAVVSFPSHGVDLEATLYLASGRGPQEQSSCWTACPATR
jgi:hypothetical protein